MLTARLERFPNGRRLRSARLGHGPPVVLLHGYPDNLQIWCRLAPRLARRHEVITFDWPGMGYSDPWSGGATPMHMAERLCELLDHWDLASASVAGIDMGGQPALAFAARYPERIDRLVVMNSLVFGDEPTSWEIGVLRRSGWNRRILLRFPRIVFRRAESTFLPRGERLTGDLRQDLWAAFRSVDVRQFIVKMCAGYQGTLDRLPRLYGRVRCPTLILWADRDGHFPPRQAERLGDNVPGSRVEILPGARHWMVWYLADEVASHIGAFLGEPCPGTGMEPREGP